MKISIFYQLLNMLRKGKTELILPVKLLTYFWVLIESKTEITRSGHLRHLSRQRDEFVVVAFSLVTWRHLRVDTKGIIL